MKAEWGSAPISSPPPTGRSTRPQAPARRALLGLAWFGVDRDSRTLGVTLEAPAKTRPRETLTLPIQLTGLRGGEEARSASRSSMSHPQPHRYEAPNPFGYFFGQKALGPEIRDLYGYLIDGMQGTLGAIRSGGDGGAANSPSRPRPRRRWRSIPAPLRRPPMQGQRELPLPAFNGTGRVMVTAWSRAKVGAAQADVATAIRWCSPAPCRAPQRG